MNDTPERPDDTVAHWMQALAADEPAGAPPDAEVIWWQARALRRLDEQRRLAALLDVDERVQLGCGLIAAVLLLLYSMHSIPQLLARPFALLAGGCITLIGIAIALTLWDARRPVD